MTDKNTHIATIENFNSTANLTTNQGFQSSISLASKDEKEKEYNPAESRNLPHPNTTIGSILHLLKACLGTGILAMPAAFKNSGILIGLIGTLAAGVLCTHTVAMVVRASQELCVVAKKPSMSYAETCGAIFRYGPPRLRSWDTFVQTLADCAMAFTYIGVLLVYVVFMGSSVKEVIDVYYPDFQLPLQGYCALTLVPLVLICQIRNLKYLVPVSALANALIVVVFGITMYFMFSDLPPVSEREMVAKVTTWPLFFSTVVFAMEGIGVVLPVENEMKNPKRFLSCPGVLNVSMVVVVSLYAIFGFFGYLQYGDEVKGSITLNLPQEYAVAQAAKLIMAIVIFFSYALQCYVPMEIITRLLEKRKSKRFENLIQVTIRTTIVIFSVATAAVFPDLELVISLVGAIFFSTLGFLIPALVDIVYRWDKGFGCCNYILWKNTIISIISIIALVSGSYVSIMEIIMSKSGHEVDTHDNSTLRL